MSGASFKNALRVFLVVTELSRCVRPLQVCVQTRELYEYGVVLDCEAELGLMLVPWLRRQLRPLTGLKGIAILAPLFFESIHQIREAPRGEANQLMTVLAN